MTGLFFRLFKITLLALTALVPTAALAQDVTAPVPGAIGFQESVTPIMDSIIAFHNGVLMWTITAIVLLVLALLLIIIVRFNRRANPVPAKFTHNTLVEIVWTVAPILVLIVIAIPSFGVLTDQLTVPDGERKYLGSNIFSWGEVEVPAATLTVKATGYQWYWGYEYSDQDEVGFDSILLSEQDRADQKPNQPRLLAVDNELVVPVDTTVRVHVTAADVIHAFAMPSFGIKIDAVPGRLNETWFNARKTGLYYGQCSELCGKDHAYMPIAIRVVTKEEFATWMDALRAGDVSDANLTLAAIN
ncbi:cytochrome c oxidase subunit II [Mariluticola halotolerans]|uniref:cytochrome c oxidase subunit II n=1 Tax=Mariluticola halotolerans TaxID=2909283 RepID=UPI003F636542